MPCTYSTLTFGFQPSRPKPKPALRFPCTVCDADPGEERDSVTATASRTPYVSDMKPTIDPDARNGISPDDLVRLGAYGWKRWTAMERSRARRVWLWHDDHTIHLDSLSREEALSPDTPNNNSMRVNGMGHFGFEDDPWRRFFATSRCDSGKNKLAV